MGAGRVDEPGNNPDPLAQWNRVTLLLFLRLFRGLFRHSAFPSIVSMIYPPIPLLSGIWVSRWITPLILPIASFHDEEAI